MLHSAVLEGMGMTAQSAAQSLKEAVAVAASAATIPPPPAASASEGSSSSSSTKSPKNVLYAVVIGPGGVLGSTSKVFLQEAGLWKI